MSAGRKQAVPSGARAVRRFIGLDLTDPYAAKPRPVDVALLDGEGRCSFTTLPMFAVGMSAADWLAPLGAAPGAGDLLVIDGPLALARPGATMRECERSVAAAGKTPDHLSIEFAPGSPQRRKPFAGFVRGSVELAQALLGEGWTPFGAVRAQRSPRASLRSSGEAGNRGAAAAQSAMSGSAASEPREPMDIRAATLLEAYPGGSWRLLAGRPLPSKATADGRKARTSLLQELGVRFQRPPRTHDELDAALCAWLGRELHRNRDRVEPLGAPCYVQAGALREGAILQIRSTSARRSTRP